MNTKILITIAALALTTGITTTATAQSGDGSEEAWNEYARLFRRWEIWGLAALLTPVAAMAIMVLKPALPGL